MGQQSRSESGPRTASTSRCPSITPPLAFWASDSTDKPFDKLTDKTDKGDDKTMIRKAKRDSDRNRERIYFYFRS